MFHKITIRDLNNWGNQLPTHSLNRKAIHEMVLRALRDHVPHIILDDTIEDEKTMLALITDAKILERMDNGTRKRDTYSRMKGAKI